MNQPRQHPHGIGAAGKAEQVDLVAGLIGVDQEGIGREHVVIEPIAGGEPQDGVEILLQFVPRVRPLQRADPRIVKHQLPRLRLLRLAQAAIELQHIGDVLGNLVAGAVAADDDVAHGELAGESGDATLASLADFRRFWRSLAETKGGPVNPEVNSDKTSTIRLDCLDRATSDRALPRWSEFPLFEAAIGQGLMRTSCPRYVWTVLLPQYPSSLPSHQLKSNKALAQNGTGCARFAFPDVRYTSDVKSTLLQQRRTRPCQG